MSDHASKGPFDGLTAEDIRGICQAKDNLIVERDLYREALKEIATRQKAVQGAGTDRFGDALAVLESYAGLVEELQSIARAALKGNR